MNEQQRETYNLRRAVRCLRDSIREIARELVKANEATGSGLDTSGIEYIANHIEEKVEDILENK